MTESQKKIYWHEAFYEAVKLELADFKTDLHFETEYHLTKEALRMDMLIVKKEKKVEIKKDFGRIFKTHNILEFKSEHDYISVHDYNKVHAYALLYSAFNKVPEDDITLTLVSARYPRDLFCHLNSKCYEITQPHGGIYYVYGEKIDCQILHINKLSNEDSLFIKSLRSNLKPEDIKNLLVACKEQGQLEDKNTFMNRVANANAKAFREVLNLSMITFDMLLREAVENRGWLREFEEKIEQLTSEKREMEQEMEHQAELEKQEMIRKAELEKQEMEQELQHKAELEKQEMIRKAKLEKQEMEQELQHQAELEKQEMIRKAKLEKREMEQELQHQAELEKQEMIRKAKLEKQEMIRRMIEDGVPLEKAEKWAGYRMDFSELKNS